MPPQSSLRTHDPFEPADRAPMGARERATAVAKTSSSYPDDIVAGRSRLPGPASLLSNASVEPRALIVPAHPRRGSPHDRGAEGDVLARFHSCSRPW